MGVAAVSVKSGRRALADSEGRLGVTSAAIAALRDRAVV